MSFINKLMPKNKSKQKFSLFDGFILLILILYSIALFALILWGVFTSFKTWDNFRTDKIGFPNPIAFENISIVWNAFYVHNGAREVMAGEMMLNTILYAFGGALLMTIAPCIVSYAVTKFKNYAYSKILNGIVIITMIMPIVGASPSMLQFMHSIHIFDTFIGMWLQKFNFLGLYFLTFSANFRSLPKEFHEAASIDGAGEWQIFLKIIAPLVRNMFFTVMLIHFVEIWNDYQVSILYLPSYPTLARGVFNVSNITTGVFQSVPNKMMACMFLIIPILTLFIIFRNKLMGNLSMGGVKE